MFSTLAQKSPSSVFFGIFLGAFSGAIYSLLIPLLMEALQHENSHALSSAPYYFFKMEIANAPIALLFGVACVLIVVCKTLSQIALARVAMDVASNLRIKLYERIAGAPVAALERLGGARLVTAMTTDIPRIVMGAQLLPTLMISAVTLVGMLGFLLYLNADVFRYVLECIFFGAVTFEIPMILAKRFFVRAGNSSDLLQKSMDGLIRGIKELKLDEAKQRAYFDADLIANERALVAAQKSGSTIMSMAISYGDMICFFAIGAIAFIFVNYHSIRNEELIGVVMALLYITSPVAIILGVVPQLSIARVSFARAEALLAELPEEGFHAPSKAEHWNTLRLRHVTYQHHSTDDVPGFKVGPLDLDFNKGQITFIVGGNGCGKSTLCKLLTLHYTALSGEIYFGKHLITPETVSTYRQNICAIYSDYYLFDRVLGKLVDPELIEHYLRVLKLDAKVEYKDGKFSTLLLSDGQRRRMALVTAFIEDKELYLFDEWAADQDPGFREAFYHEILPLLKAKGKVVIVITHDDRYFHLADKLVTMEDGMVSEVKLQDELVTNCKI